MGGNNLTTGIYGTQGIQHPNNWPGARGWGAATWTDTSGNLWLFGGWGVDANGTNYGCLNDLWKYDMNTGQWTWMKGSNLVSQPGIYGTKGLASASNNPPSRAETNSYWVDDNNNLWLFGGQNCSGGNHDLNDLWMYNISTNEWSWISGSNTSNNPGNYGTKGLGSTLNYPPSRIEHSSWTDSNGNFWVFAGMDNSNSISSPTSFGYYNDLWKYTSFRQYLDMGKWFKYSKSNWSK